jgi:hypothetical protein
MGIKNYDEQIILIECIHFIDYFFEEKRVINVARHLATTYGRYLFDHQKNTLLGIFGHFLGFFGIALLYQLKIFT